MPGIGPKHAMGQFVVGEKEQLHVSVEVDRFQKMSRERGATGWKLCICNSGVSP